ncbi:MAG: MerR family transcriptional regulator [Desulfovibrionaceae bacterium]|nr:MerR family transcriptional regulator [Desulfovibrionaceae bacterium]
MSDTRSTPARGYTKAELTRHFQWPESSIRYYCARFAPYLPAEGQGRGRRYAASCLEVLAFIRERLPEVRTSKAMDRLLARRFPQLAPARADLPAARQDTIPARFLDCDLPQNLPVDSKPETAARALRLLERQSEAMERIAASLDILAGHTPPHEQAGHGDETSRIDELRDEVRTLRLLLNSAEQTQQDDLNQLRQWISRLARERIQGGRSA